MSKKKIVLLIILILFLLPEIGDYSDMFDDDPYQQRFWNYWYRESRRKDGEWICFDVMPIPHYTYSYRSLFVDINYSPSYCEDFEWWRKWSLSLALDVECWICEPAIFLPFLWISISDKGVNVSLLGEFMGSIK